MWRIGWPGPWITRVLCPDVRAGLAPPCATSTGAGPLPAVRPAPGTRPGASGSSCLGRRSPLPASPWTPSSSADIFRTSVGITNAMTLDLHSSDGLTRSPEARRGSRTPRKKRCHKLHGISGGPHQRGTRTASPRRNRPQQLAGGPHPETLLFSSDLASGTPCNFSSFSIK